MQDIFSQYNIELSEQEIQKFQRFLTIFEETNSQINLSAIRDREWIIEKHFVDSLYLPVFFDIEPNTKIADMGTGGWFPGIPLAITHPDVDFTLIDSVGKKQKCVEDFATELKLQNVTTLTWRAEDIGQTPAYRQQFDMVVSRATAYFPTLLEYTLPLLKVWGILAAYKLTDKQEFASTKKALHRLGGKIYKIKNYTLAGQERSIVFIEKISKTPEKYPRRVWEPLKTPIL